MSRDTAIGKRLKLLREALGLTQREFASALGRTIRTVQNYEGGHRVPDEATLKLIETLFGVNPEWLREGKGSMFLNKDKEEQIKIAKSLENLPLESLINGLAAKITKQAFKDERISSTKFQNLAPYFEDIVTEKLRLRVLEVLEDVKQNLRLFIFIEDKLRTTDEPRIKEVPSAKKKEDVIIDPFDDFEF